MNIGIVGAGNMGLALAEALKDAGHDIRLSFTRDTAKLAIAAAERGARGVSPDEAVRNADVVFICVPAAQIDAALAAAGPLGNAVIVSVSSGLALDPSGKTMGVPSTRDISVAEQIAATTGSSRVVQAFTLTFADMLAARGKGQTPTLPIAGDDEDAVALVATLVSQAGFEPLPCGPLYVARALETLATATAQFAIAAGLAPLLAVRLAR